MATTKQILQVIFINRLVVPLMTAFLYAWFLTSNNLPVSMTANPIVTLTRIATTINMIISFLEGFLIFSLYDQDDGEDGNLTGRKDRGRCCRFCCRLEQRQTMIEMKWIGYSGRLRRLENNVNWADSFRNDVTEIITRIRELNRDGGD